jgi:hypothetical protein
MYVVFSVTFTVWHLTWGKVRLDGSVTDPHHFGPDPDPAYHFDPDPDPTVHSNADLDPNFQFDVDPDVDPTTHFFSRFGPSKAPKWPQRLPPFHFDADPGPDPALHFDADPDPDPAFHFDADADSDPLLKTFRTFATLDGMIIFIHRAISQLRASTCGPGIDF